MGRLAAARRYQRRYFTALLLQLTHKLPSLLSKTRKPALRLLCEIMGVRAIRSRRLPSHAPLSVPVPISACEMTAPWDGM